MEESTGHNQPESAREGDNIAPTDAAAAPVDIAAPADAVAPTDAAAPNDAAVSVAPVDLATLIRGWKAISGQPDDIVRKARLVTTYALVSGQTVSSVCPPYSIGTAFVRPDLAAEPSSDDLDKAALNIIAVFAGGGTPGAVLPPARVLLRPANNFRTPLHYNGRPIIGQGQVVDEIIGPFEDGFGRRMQLDVFRPPPAGYETGPHGLLYSAPSATSTTGPQFRELKKCTIWVPVTPFLAGLPAGGYFGLNVDSGTIEYPIISADVVMARLRLRLQPSLTTGPQPETIRFPVVTPGNVTIMLGAATGRLEAASNASAAAFGISAELQFSGAGVPTYDADSMRLRFQFQLVNADRVSIGGPRGNLVRIGGTVPVRSVGWSLPLAVISSGAPLSLADGNGAISLSVGSGLNVTFLDDRPSWTIGDAEILISPDEASISGKTARSRDAQSIDVQVRPPALPSFDDGGAANRRPAPASRSAFELRAQRTQSPVGNPGTEFRYLAKAQPRGEESWAYTARVKPSLDAPRTVDGHRASYASPAAVYFYRGPPSAGDHDSAATSPMPTLAIEGVRLQIAPRAPRESFALTNLVLIAAEANSIFAYGTYDPAKRAMVDGAVNLSFTTINALPTLPDPYVSNIDYNWPPQVLGTPLCFKLPLGKPPTAPGSGSGSGSAPLSPPPLPRIEVQIPRLALSAVRVLPDPVPAGEEKPYVPYDALLLKDVRDPTSWKSRYREDLEPMLRSDPALLDVSSSASQLGVTFSSELAAAPAGAAGGTLALAARGVTAIGRASALRLFALPAVQCEQAWMEDVATAGNDSYMIPTKLVSNSPALVPLAPGEVLGEAVRAYNKDPAGRRVAVSFQLPFSAIAYARIEKTQPGMPPTPPTPPQGYSVDFVRPAFDSPPAAQLAEAAAETTTAGGRRDTAVRLTGADQVSFVPVPRGPPTDISRFTFPGFAFYPQTFLTGSAPMPDFMTDQFNSQFATHLPLTRFDLSGYGASMFSHWQPDSATLFGISKVHLDVLVGRTARQVVQMSSIMYPYGVRVIRTVTITRLNTGNLAGRDSGWVAASEGDYDFRRASTDPENPLKTHRGLVLRVHNVTNIRPVPGSENLVKFDCDMVIEGISSMVRALDQTGYVKTRASPSNNDDPKPQSLLGSAAVAAGDLDPPSPLTPDEYADILRKTELGGPINAVLPVGQSGQVVRVTRVTVGSALAPNGTSIPEFPVALWGVPVVPGAGQWSFSKSVAEEGGRMVHSAVDSWGVPLVRQGLQAADAVDNAIKIADPVGLLNGRTSPYSLIFSGGSHRLQFPSPSFLPASAGDLAKGLHLGAVPTLADGFSLAASTGLFPSGNVLPLNGAPQLVNIAAGGNYQFSLPDTGLTLENAPLRTLRESEQFASVVEMSGRVLADGRRELARVGLAVDSALNLKDLNLTGVAMVTLGKGKKELSRVVGDLVNDVQGLPAFKSAEHLFGQALDQVQKVVNFLNELHVLPPLKVSMTNEWALEVSTNMGLEEFMARLGPAGQALKNIIQSFNFALRARTTLGGASFMMAVDIAVRIPTGFGPMALGIGGFKVAASSSGGVSVTLTLGAGIGIDFRVSFFGATGHYSQSQSITAGGDAYGAGATCVLHLSVNLVVASADLTLEARLGLLGGKCNNHNGHPKDTIYAYAQVRIALHVSIFLVINCTVDESAEWETKLNDGQCLLRDMEAM